MSRKVLGKVTRKVIRIGDSLAITIPKDFLKAHKIEEGMIVDIFFNDRMVIKPIKPEDVEKEIYGKE